MKITQSQLRQIIKEELDNVVNMPQKVVLKETLDVFSGLKRALMAITSQGGQRQKAAREAIPCLQALQAGLTATMTIRADASSVAGGGDRDFEGKKQYEDLIGQLEAAIFQLNQA
tara:strand:+ start:127 stop:471 length:345 start_codon:yes stop_codon:yes gene_type:complete